MNSGSCSQISSSCNCMSYFPDIQACRLSQSPSLLISGSGRPQRKVGLSPEAWIIAARQIYRRNFPPVGVFSNHERFYWCAVNQTRSRLMKSDLNCFDPNSIDSFSLDWTEYFLRAVFRFRFIACIQIQSFSRHFISIWVLYQGRIFLAGLAATGRTNITHLFCFECAHYKVFLWELCNNPETSGDWTYNGEGKRKKECCGMACGMARGMT